jgi:hypothetical protein
MNVLVCLANYGEGQLEFLETVLEGYGRMSSRFRIFVILDTTVPIAFSDLDDRFSIVQFRFKPEIREGLAFVHRQHMIEHQNNYDLFVYSENDILIQEGNLEAFLRETERLPQGYVTGFLRYERKENDEELYLIDAHPHFPVIKEKGLEIRGRRYFSPCNLHQGSWVLTQDQLKQAIQSGGFDVMPHFTESEDGFVGILEAGASDVFTECGFKQKVMPHEGIDDLLVHHLPNKYIRKGGIWEDPGPLTLPEFKKLLGP